MTAESRFAGAAGILVALSVAAAGCASSHGRSAGGAAPAPSAAQTRAFARAIERKAAEWGDSHPTHAFVVLTTQRNALLIEPGSRPGRSAPATPAYLVVARGDFVASDVPRPPGAKSPTGTVLTMTFDAKTNRLLAEGLLHGARSLARAGKPEPLPAQGGTAASCDSSCLFWARQSALDHAATYAENVAGAAHVFAGDRIDDAANKTIVYLVHAPQSVLAKLQARHPWTYVIHNNAPRTLHDVVALQNSMDWSAWGARGIAIADSFPTGTGYLVVGVSTSIAKAQAAFDATYGRGIIRVVRGEPSEPTSASGPVVKPSR